MARTLILGGGFGGIATAVAVRRLAPEDEVVLVDRRSTFTMGLRKNWGIVGAEPLSTGTRSLSRLSRHGIEVRRGTIEAIEPEAIRAQVDGTWIEADSLVVALGAERDPGRVPGFGEHVLDAYDEAANGRIAAAVAGVRGGKVGIGIFAAPYPCPPAPFELALVLHERFETLGVPAEIEVFSALPASVPILGQAGCEAFDARLNAVGIAFLPGRQAKAVAADGVEFGDERRAYDLLIGIPPHRVPAVVGSSSLAGPSVGSRSTPGRWRHDFRVSMPSATSRRSRWRTGWPSRRPACLPISRARWWPAGSRMPEQVGSRPPPSPATERASSRRAAARRRWSRAASWPIRPPSR